MLFFPLSLSPPLSFSLLSLLGAWFIPLFCTQKDGLVFVMVVVWEARTIGTRWDGLMEEVGHAWAVKALLGGLDGEGVQEWWDL